MAIIFSLTMLSAFANDDLAQQKKDSVAIKTLKEATVSLAKTDMSCTKDSDCVVFGLGKRACGGPNGFVVASKNNLLIEEVEYLAKQTVEREDEYNSKYGVFSICSILRGHIPTCASKVCR